MSTAHDLDTPHLFLRARDAARAAGVTPGAIARAAREGRLRIAARTRHGTRLYAEADVAAYRLARIARLARQLRAAAEPRDSDAWDAEQSAALDLAVAVQARLEREARR